MTLNGKLKWQKNEKSAEFLNLRRFSNISHIRKMISRIEKTQIKAPSDTKIYKFKRFGSDFMLTGLSLNLQI